MDCGAGAGETQRGGGAGAGGLDFGAGGDDAGGGGGSYGAISLKCVFLHATDAICCVCCTSCRAAKGRVQVLPSNTQHATTGAGAGSWEYEWSKGYAGDSEVAANPHALVLYQDKAAAAMDTHEKAMNIKKGRKQPKRTLKDAAAYKHGQRDAETVALGTKKLKSAA